MRSEMRVDNATTAAQLRDFIDQARQQAGDDDLKLRAKTLDDGSTLLYATDRQSNIFNRMSGRAAEKRMMARDTVFEIMRRSPGVTDAAVGAVRTALETRVSPSLRTDKVLTLIDFAQANKVQGQMIGTMPGPVRNSIEAEVHLFAAGQRNAGPDRGFEGALLSGIRGAVMSHLGGLDGQAGLARREELATSNGDAFVAELVGMLERQGPIPGYPERRDLSALARQIFNSIASEATGNSFTPEGKLVLDGETYAPVREIGRGGFGIATLYRKDSDPQSEVVVKQAIPDEFIPPSEQFNDMAHEARMQRRALAGGGENMLPLKGVVRTPEGQLFLVTPLANKGEAADAFRALAREADRARTDGSRYSSDEVRAMQLTLLRDMALGLEEMRAQGIFHQDVKQPNAFLHDGHALIADFGAALDTPQFAPSNTNSAGNPRWQAPEILHGLTLNSDQRMAIGNRRDQLTADARDQIAQRLFGGREANDQVAARALNTIARSFGETALSTDPIMGRQQQVSSEGGDLWSFGMTVAEVFIGEDLNRFDSGFEPSEWVAEYVNKDPATVPLGPDGFFITPDQPNDPAYGGDGLPTVSKHYDAEGNLVFNSPRAMTSGDATVDALINKLLSVRPEDRGTLAEILDHPAFRLPGVGSDETRQLIAGLELGG